MIPDADHPAMHLELPSTFDVLENLIETAQEFFAAYVSDEDLLYRIVLLASEAATNAIEHGNRLDPSLKVQIWFGIIDSRAAVVVEDQGGGFNPEKVGDPLSSEHILDDRGRGIFLMKELADDVEWDNNGRRVAVYVDLPAD